MVETRVASWLSKKNDDLQFHLEISDVSWQTISHHLGWNTLTNFWDDSDQFRLHSFRSFHSGLIPASPKFNDFPIKIHAAAYLIFDSCRRFSLRGSYPTSGTCILTIKQIAYYFVVRRDDWNTCELNLFAIYASPTNRKYPVSRHSSKREFLRYFDRCDTVLLSINNIVPSMRISRSPSINQFFNHARIWFNRPSRWNLSRRQVNSSFRNRNIESESSRI